MYYMTISGVKGTIGSDAENKILKDGILINSFSTNAVRGSNDRAGSQSNRESGGATVSPISVSLDANAAITSLFELTVGSSGKPRTVKIHHFITDDGQQVEKMMIEYKECLFESWDLSGSGELNSTIHITFIPKEITLSFHTTATDNSHIDTARTSFHLGTGAVS